MIQRKICATGSKKWDDVCFLIIQKGRQRTWQRERESLQHLNIIEQNYNPGRHACFDCKLHLFRYNRNTKDTPVMKEGAIVTLLLCFLEGYRSTVSSSWHHPLAHSVIILSHHKVETHLFQPYPTLQPNYFKW